MTTNKYIGDIVYNVTSTTTIAKSIRSTTISATTSTAVTDVISPYLQSTLSIDDAYLEFSNGSKAYENNIRSTTYIEQYYNDMYDISYIAKVNPFWLHFKPPSNTTFYIMGTIYCIISSIGLIGNAFVIYMFIRCKSLRTAGNKLVINLACSDFIMLLKCPIAAYNNFKRGPALGEFACRLYGFLGGLSGTASIGTLTAIALDRYNVVVHPLNPHRWTSKMKAHWYIIVIWCYSCLFAIIPALNIGLSIYVPEGFLTTCSFDYLNREWPPRIFMFSFFVAAWCIPLIIICSSYFYILKVVFATNRIQSNRDKNKIEQKLSIIVFMIIGLWFIAWTPYSIVAMMGLFGLEEYLTPLGSMIPALFCKTAACIDPYVYAATHPRFRKEFRRLIYGKQRIRRSSTTRSSFVAPSSMLRPLRTITDADVKEHHNRSIDMLDNVGKIVVTLSVVPEVNEDTITEEDVTMIRMIHLGQHNHQSVKEITEENRF